MAGVYKTPGVFIEEIPKFPPSIAPVETAIPVFIGYTARAVRGGEPLLNKAIRIESIAEYESYYGGSPPQNVTITLDSNNRFVKAEAADEARYYLYDSLRMFYANGGGKCYILSVGSYDDAVASATLEAALLELEKEDEPTIIMAPDAVSDTNGPYSFQQQALLQCNKLKDRVTVCDLLPSTTNTEFNNTVAAFRDNIGINNLKYGAAYAPWLRANLPRNLLLRNVDLVRDGGGDINISSLTTDSDIQALISDIRTVETAVDAAATQEETMTGDPNVSLEDHLKTLIDTYHTTDIVDGTAAGNVLTAIGNFAVDVINDVRVRYNAAPVAAGNRFKLRDDVDNYITSSGVSDALETASQHHNHTTTLTDAFSILTSGNLGDVATFLSVNLASTLSDTSAYGTDVAENAGVALSPALAAANEAIAFFRFMQETQRNYERTLNESLIASFGLYRDLVNKGAEALNLLPPSGAVAGVYASTDRDRGVWKAPANVSLNAVLAPAVKISQEQQAEFNVDVNSGKSINIIRAFTGKGVLVWGARTLAGNDNEWRYVSVRRFFNFVEESTKKATEQFTFEPNDANTWVKVQAMIENFLTTLWRQGALQGVKPQHAFYVAVGLGTTMTPLDILEGRMIVEIGMAAVRPAEFIILRFSHKMAES